MRYLITGSREISQALLDKVEPIVAILAKANQTVIVGDAPGVDQAVITACDKLGCKVEVHGAYGKLRHRTKTGENVIHDKSYHDRDMVMASMCDVTIAIWNGQSRGTMQTLDAARKSGKQCWMFK